MQYTELSARHFAIGDIQGCLEPLQKLLDKINYNANQDTLWFTGDLVNRGPHSLRSLRFIKSLPNMITVLGNHDVALLAVAHEATHLRKQDSFAEIIAAPDRDELLNWLQQRPFLHHDATLKYTLTHAGIHPRWTLQQAIHYAKEVENLLQGESFKTYLHHIFGALPNVWDENLQGWERARLITNVFTRMRFCLEDGQLDFSASGTVRQHPDLIPWFEMKHRPTENDRILFGHWSALGGQTSNPHAIALDTGCVWGNCLTAFCLQTQERITVDCEKR